MTGDGYRSAKRDELDSMVERFSRGSTESMSSAAAMGDRLHKEYLVPAYDHVLRALAALPPGGGQAIDVRRGAIDALRESLLALIVGSVVLSGTLNTVAQGFRQVRTTIDNLPARPAPAAFNEPDRTMTWLDRPPLDEYEAGVLNDLTIVRAAVARYQTTTEAAVHDLRDLRGFTPNPGEDPAGGGLPVGPPWPTSTLPLGGAARPTPDEVAFALPVRPPASAWTSSEFGPTGHAAEDVALAEEPTQPIHQMGVRLRSAPPPAVYQAVIVTANTEKTIFDADEPVVPPVIGE